MKHITTAEGKFRQFISYDLNRQTAVAKFLIENLLLNKVPFTGEVTVSCNGKFSTDEVNLLRKDTWQHPTDTQAGKVQKWFQDFAFNTIFSQMELPLLKQEILQSIGNQQNQIADEISEENKRHKEKIANLKNKLVVCLKENERIKSL